MNVLDINSLIYGIMAIVFAGLISLISIPPVRVLAFKVNAIDVPKDNRRMHKEPIPRMGGVAIFIAFAVATLIFADIDLKIIGLLTGALLVVVLGALDDIYRLPAMVKLAFQILISFVPILCGTKIEFINLFGKYIHFGIWSIPVTVIWIVAITNAINLIDGLDGLACGVSTISSFSLLVISLLQPEISTSVTIMLAVLAGSCLGFLPYNHNPAKIFMGDSGALFLGYTLSVISVQGLFKMDAVVAFWTPFLILGLPIADTLFAIIRRIIHKQPPFAPDRGHFHHKLIDIGFSQKQAVVILYSISAILGVSAIMFSVGRVWGALAIIVIAAIIGFFNYRIFLGNKETRDHTGIILKDNSKENDDGEKK